LGLVCQLPQEVQLMVPKLIHFVWLGELPAWAQVNIDAAAALNPDWTVHVHGEGSLAAEYAAAYHRARDVQTRADYIRYSVLHEQGGLYMDADCRSVKPLPELDVGGRLGVPGIEYPQFNTVLACEPGCEALAAIPEAIEQLDSATPMIGTRGLYRAWQANPSAFAMLGLARWTAGAEADQYQYARIQEGLDPHNLPPEQVIIHAWRGGRP
jgi:hypothetical protein